MFPPTSSTSSTVFETSAAASTWMPLSPILLRFKHKERMDRLKVSALPSAVAPSSEIELADRSRDFRLLVVSTSLAKCSMPSPKPVEDILRTLRFEFFMSANAILLLDWELPMALLLMMMLCRDLFTASADARKEAPYALMLHSAMFRSRRVWGVGGWVVRRVSGWVGEWVVWWVGGWVGGEVRHDR
jgi:hypothetical protein